MNEKNSQRSAEKIKNNQKMYFSITISKILQAFRTFLNSVMII